MATKLTFFLMCCIIPAKLLFASHWTSYWPIAKHATTSKVQLEIPELQPANWKNVVVSHSPFPECLTKVALDVFTIPAHAWSEYQTQLLEHKSFVKDLVEEAWVYLSLLEQGKKIQEKEFNRLKQLKAHLNKKYVYDLQALSFLILELEKRGLLLVEKPNLVSGCPKYVPASISRLVELCDPKTLSSAAYAKYQIQIPTLRNPHWVWSISNTLSLGTLNKAHGILQKTIAKSIAIKNSTLQIVFHSKAPSTSSSLTPELLRAQNVLFTMSAVSMALYYTSGTQQDAYLHALHTGQIESYLARSSVGNMNLQEKKDWAITTLQQLEKEE